MSYTKPVLIAEAGNCHEGSFDTAIEMIDCAKGCGADMVKFQAGTAEGFARKPDDIDRYRKYELEYDNYRKLVQYGNENKIPVFFSVWDDKFRSLNTFYHKIPARQYTKEIVSRETLKAHKCFVSIPYSLDIKSICQVWIGNGIPMHCVTEYPAENPHLLRIPILRNILRRDCGYSDHSIGIDACLRAVHEYGATVIEKHFTLAHDFGPLRDHALSADPNEFEELALSIK